MEKLKKQKAKNCFKTFGGSILMILASLIWFLEENLIVGILFILGGLLLITLWITEITSFNKKVKSTLEFYNQLDKNIKDFIKDGYDLINSDNKSMLIKAIKEELGDYDFEGYVFIIFNNPNKKTKLILKSFIEQFTPLPDEWLLVASNDHTDKKIPGRFLITNKRLFYQLKDKPELVELYYNEVVKYKKLGGNLEVVYKNGEVEAMKCYSLILDAETFFELKEEFDKVHEE